MRIKFVIVSILLLFSSSSFASFECSISSSGNKNCTYIGKIKQVYLNKSGLVLIYPVESITISLATDIGFSGVTQRYAIAAGYIYNSSDDKLAMEFTKGIMALATSAKLSDSDVVMAFTDRGTNIGYRISSYLKLERFTLR